MKKSHFKLGDKLGYVSPFEESPFRKDWAERREREAEVREEMEKRKDLSSVSLYEDKDRKKTQNYRTNLYVAINEEFNKATSQSAIIEGWTLFNVNSIDDEKFIQHIQHYKWDTLIISTHGTSGDMYVDNAYFVEHNINMVEERHGGWFYFGVNADNKHLTMFSAYFANYLKQTYKLNIEGGNAPKDPTSVGYASLTESDIKKMNETFATIFMCAKSDARFLFNACKNSNSK